MRQHALPKGDKIKMSIIELLRDKDRVNSIKRYESKIPDKKKKINIFDYLRQICEKGTRQPYDRKLAPAFLITMWLSHEKDLVNLCQAMNIRHWLDDKDVYNFYFHKVPKGRRFIRWTKKDETYLKEQEEIEEIMLEYNVSNREATMIKQHKERIK